MKIKATLSNGAVFEQATNKSTIVLGRSPKCEIAIPDESLSRQHAKIEFHQDNYYLTDLGSSNGVFIDGQRLPAHKKTLFQTFQNITLGIIEISVADTSDNDNFYSQQFSSTASQAKPIINESHTISKKIQHTPKAKPTPKKINEKKKSTISPAALLSFLTFLGAAIYFWQQQSTPKDQPLNNLAPNIVKHDSSPDQFMDMNYYMLQDTKKGCHVQGTNICEELKLQADKQEGVTENDHQYFIFIRPHSHAGFKEEIKGLTPEQNLLLLSVELALKSSLFKKFHNKDVAQLSVVLKNQNYLITQVIRFHSKYFAKNGPERAKLFTAIRDTRETGQWVHFQRATAPIIFSQSF